MDTAVDVRPDTLNTPHGAAFLRVPTGELCIPALSTSAARPIKLSLVIPTYNECGNIGELVRLLTWLLDEHLGDAYELIVVDDDSPDRTWETAAQLATEYRKLYVMRRVCMRDPSTAVIRGWQAARGKVLAVFDPAFHHPPEIIVELWKQIEQGMHLAVASRHVHRRILSRATQLLGLDLLPGVTGRVTQPMSGYFMVRRSAIARKVMNPRGGKILLEVLRRGEVRSVGKVGYLFREQLECERQVSFGLYVDYVRHLVRVCSQTALIAWFARRVRTAAQWSAASRRPPWRRR